MSKTSDVTIVGAGLVGSLLAILLAKRGLSITVYDKRPDMRRTDISAGKSINLALAERGIAALKKAGVFESVETQLVPMRGRMLHQPDGQVEFQPYGWRPEEQIYSVSRGGLNKLLMTAAEQCANVRIEFELPCETVDFEDKTLALGEGKKPEVIRYEKLIGADGAGSAVRAAISAATSGEDRTEFLDHGYKELSIPAGEGGAFQIQREALHIWPRGGFMLIALPNSDGSFTLTLFLPNESEPGHAQKRGLTLSGQGQFTGESTCPPKGQTPFMTMPSFAALQNDQDVANFFEQQFPDAVRLLPNLSEEFRSNPTGILGTVRCWPWTHGPDVLLIGDAAHAIVPFHGQGMNCGFEDCAALIDQLDQCNDWGLAVEQFAKRRKPNADAIAQMALENYITMRDSVRDPKFQLRKQLEFELERRFPDRFIPRYSMVMFHHMPYSEALQRGQVQDELLKTLMADANDLNDVDFERAARMVGGWEAFG